MPRRFQFSLKALMILMFGLACFFGGIAIGRKRERQLQIELTAANKAALAQQRRVYAGSLLAAEKRIAELQEARPIPTETAPRMPTLRQRTERMPTLREPSAIHE